jgi:hypothetical protein
MGQFLKRNQKKEREIARLVKTHGPKSKAGCKKFLSNFLKAFGFKIKDSNTFKLNLNGGKLFEDFSNLKLSKISLNIQIQTKALNEGLLK